MVLTLRGTQYLSYAAQRPERIYTEGRQGRPRPPQGRGVGSDEADRLPQTVMDVQFGIPDPEIDSHVIR